ncbi:MAG TPA: hypothetical protein VKH81_09050 [Candidatus Angelobacter sp.]|nr:hypothetical protein [Candidatus Angelobacter sp.]
MKHWNQVGVPVLILLAAALAQAADRGTLIRESPLYSSAGSSSQKVGQVERGRDLTIQERKDADGQAWFRISMAADQAAQITKELDGWVPGQAMVTASTANGDQIIFGQAVASEHEAEERGGRKGAAQDAQRLYARVAEFFPSSSLAAEAAWRSADIRWQLAKADVRSGTPPEEKYLQEVITRYPNTKQAQLAAFELLEGKLCPEWRGLPDCPEKESAMYEQYAREYPQSPKAAEALYNAAWRQAALADMYRIDNNNSKSDAARKKGTTLAQQIMNQYPQGDWKPRASDLLYKLEKKIPTFGSATQ